MIPDPTSSERGLGPWTVPAVGFGCMNLSHAYGVPPAAADAGRMLERAFELGVRHFDTAALYGFGANEELVGAFLKGRRADVVLASKCGMRAEDGRRTIDGRPHKLREDLENSLRRLQTDVIDLYYLHRFDNVTPIEESVGELSRFVEKGMVREIGLSEMSAAMIRTAHAVHPLAAVQSEYSLWSRNVEIAVLDACRELHISFVAFSPLGRGFLTDVDLDPAAFVDKDIRRSMPRFREPHFSNNGQLLRLVREIAGHQGCTTAQLALAWVLRRATFVHVIPGTTSASHLEENLGVFDVVLTDENYAALEIAISPQAVSGERYDPAAQANIATEEFIPA